MANNEWQTPDWLFKRLDAVFHFEIDLAASAENAKCPRYLTTKTDALKQEAWGDTFPAWLNPPYSDLMPWMEKIRREINYRDAAVVALLPVATSTHWFQHVWEAADWLLFFNKRIRFEPATGSPRFDNVLALFNCDIGEMDLVPLRDLGKWIEL